MPDDGDRARARRIIDRVRSYEVEVREMPGHETRGGTFVVVPVKVFDHHDASSRKSGEWGSLGLILDGTPRGIPGPLSNAQVARCLDGVPRVAWVADGTCSHAGLGSGLGLPTNDANRRVYGVEKANDGIIEPYTDAANYAANALFHAMAVESGADPATYAWGHKEWTTRKVDPTYSMHERRRQVGAFRSQEDDDMTPEQAAQIAYIYETMTPGEAGRKGAGRGWTALYEAARDAASSPVDLDALADKVAARLPAGGLSHDDVKKALREVLREGTGE
jgi:hypothetical protein